jgi:hypothetical protein
MHEETTCLTSATVSTSPRMNLTVCERRDPQAKATGEGHPAACLSGGIVQRMFISYFDYPIPRC